MAFPPANSVTAVSFHGLGNDQKTLTTFHYATLVPFLSANNPNEFYDLLWDQIKGAGAFDIVTPFLNCCSNDLS